MNKLVLCIIILCISISSYPQPFKDTINEANVRRIITILASDSLKGRGNHTTSLHKAADFIANEFAATKLQFHPAFKSYFQPFITTKVDAANVTDSSGGYNPKHVLLNVIAVLPGKSLPNEAIIFSAHYDHLGMQESEGENIFNGANDNASGTTALLVLANYYALRNDNERTLVFCAFAGEELGLYGSAAFLKYILPDQVKAMINIEMIGRKNIAGKNAFIITGAQFSNLENIIRKNLKRTKIRVYSERDHRKMLFQRSDNYLFAREGIPAHTIMSSDDDDECYHQPCDEVERIDIQNMTEIIKAIAIACRTLINGRDTPSRISAKL
ncbi:MAG: M28 family peptidase [Chitinophagaceae bacterium]